MTGQVTTQITTPPPPPRMTGNSDTDFASLVTWAYDFHQVVTAQNEALNTVIGFDAGSFDINNLPDPATATVGSAQQTANDAYSLAATAKSQAQANEDNFAALIEGAVTVSGVATTTTHTFATAEVDANYRIFLQCIGTTGSPVADSSVIVLVVNATADFTITVAVAPGSGNDVTFGWFLKR